MPNDFSPADWAAIDTQLASDPAAYGLPDLRSDSVVLMSWNIRAFGSLVEEDGATPSRTEGARALIARVCAQADLIAVQEVIRDMGSLYDLHARLEAMGEPWGIVVSDVTGKPPGYTGHAERMAYLYRKSKVRRGDLASDLGFDRSAVLKNANAALAEVAQLTMQKEGEQGLWAQVTAWLSGQQKIVGSKLKSFVQFMRAPHLVECVIEGPDGAYELYCINAHLVSGSSKRERELEFFALIEWMLKDSPETVESLGKTYMLMGDLNLDFKSNVDARRAAFDSYIASLNGKKALAAKVNFPFLDGGFFTNARKDATYDHIAWVSCDTRLPRGRHNPQAGSFGPDEYDYGMFDFVGLFSDAGPGGPADDPAFERYEFDFTDHMPIWVRLPIPHAGQTRFIVAEDA